MRTIFHLVATPDGLDLKGGEEADLPDLSVVLITFDVPVSRLINSIPELRELVSTLTQERDEARAEVEKLRTLPSAEDLEERAHEILDNAGIPTHALDPVSGEEDYRADLEERLEWTVAEITRLRRALEPFARFGAAVLLIDSGSGKWHSIRVEGHEYTIFLEDFRRARAVLTGEGEA